MKLTIEIPDKNLQDLADTFSLSNNENLQSNMEKYLANHVYKEMRIKIADIKRQEIQSLVDAEIAKQLGEGEIKPGAIELK